MWTVSLCSWKPPLLLLSGLIYIKCNDVHSWRLCVYQTSIFACPWEDEMAPQELLAWGVIMALVWQYCLWWSFWSQWVGNLFNMLVDYDSSCLIEKTSLGGKHNHSWWVGIWKISYLKYPWWFAILVILFSNGDYFSFSSVVSIIDYFVWYHRWC